MWNEVFQTFFQKIAFFLFWGKFFFLFSLKFETPISSLPNEMLKDKSIFEKKYSSRKKGFKIN
jgi:hypothetical protein